MAQEKQQGLNKEEVLEKLKELEFETPMMQQYLEIKKKYPDCLLLFRLGDFYELFLDDAKIGAEILNITLTSRTRGRDGRVPMCGIPYHAVDSYLGKIIAAGYKAAICEQVEDASETSGMVDREVVRVVTPGTVLDDKNLEQKENNFILGLEVEGGELGIAYADISTGELYVHQLEFEDLEKTLAGEFLRLTPSEIISSHKNYNRSEILRALRVVPETNIYPFDEWERAAGRHSRVLKDHFDVVSLEGFGIQPDQQEIALKAAAALLSYLQETQKSTLRHIKKITPYWGDRYMRLDASTVANLELFKTLRGNTGGGVLLDVVDHTRTAPGGRMLRQWLLRPLREKSLLESRLDSVEILLNEPTEREKLQELLAEVLDLERLISRTAVGTANPRDLAGLKNSLNQVKKIRAYLVEQVPGLESILTSSLLKQVIPLVDLLEEKLKKDPPATLADGGYIAEGVDEHLDELRDIYYGSKEWMDEFEQEQREKTGIEKLKVDRNKVYGFYIEVSKAKADRVPPEYINKQTLVNSERYIVPELKQREEAALQAEEEIKSLEREIFSSLLNQVVDFAESVQNVAERVGRLDCFCSLAEVAQNNRYTRPLLTEGRSFEIKQGRHPVIESLQDEPFVPNDAYLGSQEDRMLLITGPNMSGKSTYLRQVALITLLAQIGSFVPADEAKIPLRDQIFTRVGASDNISLGQSTFLVEMMETANILHHCTRDSLIIFDEIGRGTSTFDGMSIAWAVLEYMVKKKEKTAMTLFATHYHELTALGEKYPELKNLQVAVKREEDEIVFLHKVVPGSAWQSYGVEVARLAGLPSPVVTRAKKILQRIKKNQEGVSTRGSNDDEKQIRLLDSK